MAQLSTGAKSWQTRGMSLMERFEFRLILIPFTDCWFFDGHHDKDGYATICVNKRTRHAYRVAYETIIGPVPDGRVLDHKCRNRACVNPYHLEPVTNRENVVERSESSVTAINARKIVCKYGHKDWVKQGNHRVCWTCEKRRWNEEHARWRSKHPPKGRALKSHCVNGHPRSHENVTADRSCRKCKAISMARRRMEARHGQG